MPGYESFIKLSETYLWWCSNFLITEDHSYLINHQSYLKKGLEFPVTGENGGGIILPIPSM
jgi:hypothetical protein